jgi:acetyl-CoA carboxylase carboxyl transferase subunit alpha
MHTYLDFESQVAEFEAKIAELKALSADDPAMAIDEEVSLLEGKAAKSLAELYAKLDPWQKAQVARHPHRPHYMDYARSLFTGFTALAGDRKFGDDRSILGGPAWFGDQPVMLIGQEKGHDTQARIAHNFAMARPEGYRKAVRLMEMAERFGLPVISFIDTPGAYPGIGAEERGQSEAIARSIDCGLGLTVASIAVIIGEGGSGGAVAIATANRVLMLEHAIYSVISPEGAASILWRDSNKAEDAAVALKITAADLKQLKVIDEIIPEPVGGAHRDPEHMMAKTGEAISEGLAKLKELDPEETRRQRREKFLAIGRSL